MKKLDYSVRPATLDDLDRVFQIEKDNIVPPWSLKQFQEELEKETSHFWVITDNETDLQILAYVVFYFPAEQAHIVTIAVDNGNKRRGLGLFLLRRVISFVMKNNGQSLILEVRKSNTSALALYQKAGFSVIRTILKFYPDGEDAYVMMFQTEPKKLAAESNFESDDHEQRSNLN